MYYLDTILRFIAISVVALVLLGCHTHHLAHAPAAGYRYATLLSKTEGDGYTQVTVANPWSPGTVLATYVLVPIDSVLPDSLPSGIVLRTPLHRTAVFTSVHCGLLYRLGVLGKVAAVADTAFIMLPEVHNQLRVQAVGDLGSSHRPNSEYLATLRPDAVLLSPLEGEKDQLLHTLRLSPVWCADYMEPTPLARAEWVRFYGLLYGVPDVADSLFARIEEAYDSLRILVQGVSERPKVLIDLPMSGTWYTPGGRSYVASLLADAGLHYAYAADSTMGSIITTAEQALLHSDATRWLIRYYQRATPYTMTQLSQDLSIAPYIAAFAQRGVYGCNTAVIPYYDETPFAPHLLLRDLVRIAHPRLLPTDTLRYFAPLN